MSLEIDLGGALGENLYFDVEELRSGCRTRHANYPYMEFHCTHMPSATDLTEEQSMRVPEVTDRIDPAAVTVEGTPLRVSQP